MKSPQSGPRAAGESTLFPPEAAPPFGRSSRLRPIVAALLMALAVLAGCGGGSEHSHDNGLTHSHDDEAPAEEEVENLSDTVWNDRFELFMEHPPIRAGEAVDFLVHLTILEGSRPVTEGPVDFRFSRRGDLLREVTVDAPLRPGIFSLETSFDSPGPATMAIEIGGGPVQGEVQASPLTVHPAEAALADMQQESSLEGTITFLKEQQWTLPFSTVVAGPRTLQASITAPAEVTAPSGRDSSVFSPAEGLYRKPSAGLPLLGRSVEEGELLGWIELTPEGRSNIAGNQVAAGLSLVRLRNDLAEAESAVAREKSRAETARRELERVQRLLALEAVPRKRLEQARSHLRIRQAALEAAVATRRVLKEQLDGQVSRTRDVEQVDQRFPLRSSLDGKIAESEVADGQWVASRQQLFRIIDLRRAWVKARVSESEIGRLGSLSGATLLLPGRDDSEIPAQGLVDVGSVVDPSSRTVAVVWKVDNPRGTLKAGMLAEIRMRTGQEKSAAVAVPAEAVLIEDNKSVLYTQVTGESFSRRIVRTGARDRGWVEVLEGAKNGDRVVVRGAYEVALAARSGDASAAHGHAH